ncbi:MAG: tRNA (N(6)-L-threonylcarbamoyladenosine(37)-C(2))-methylthiotransferase MtaB [Erysipelotrichaceae bacterium]
MTTFAIHTLGCKVNSYESIGYEQGLLDLGYECVEPNAKADVYIINTCAVTNTASAKSRQKIHQAKLNNPDAIIVVVGCYVQMESKTLIEKEGIDIAIGSDQKHQLPSLIKKALQNHQKYNVVNKIENVKVFEALPISHFYDHTRAFLKVQDGCNQFCSYCIIPYARGRERSLPMADAIKIASDLCASGHQEIVLAGIHTGRYGHDINCNLTMLLKAMLPIKGLKRIRISSIEMNEISDELIDLMKDNPKIARHLHIPIQSACDKTLKRMNRPYLMNEFKTRIDEIRNQLGDNISISSDVIVGFPGESEEDFNETIINIKQLNFSFLHVFPYSKRDHSAAAQMSGHLENKVKKQRANVLIKLSKELYTLYKRQFIGENLEVLFEKASNGYLIGHSSEYVEVKIKDEEYLHKMSLVHITDLKEDYLIGELVEVQNVII